MRDDPDSCTLHLEVVINGYHFWSVEVPINPIPDSAQKVLLRTGSLQVASHVSQQCPASCLRRSWGHSGCGLFMCSGNELDSSLG